MTERSAATENNFELGQLYCDINNALFLNHPTQADLEGLEARWAQLQNQERLESARTTTDNCLSTLRTRVMTRSISDLPESLRDRSDAALSSG